MRLEFWTVQFSEIARNYGLVVAAAIGLWLAWRSVVAANRQSEAAILQAEIANR